LWAGHLHYLVPPPYFLFPSLQPSPNSGLKVPILQPISGAQPLFSLKPCPLVSDTWQGWPQKPEGGVSTGLWPLLMPHHSILSPRPSGSLKLYPEH
jgi:hypothetical protein